MTSRDGSNRYGRQPTPKPPRSNQQGQFGLDADELDRYMSGQPAKQPRFDPYGRSQSTGQTRTVRPAAAPQPQYQQPVNDAYQEWDDQEYDDGYEYDDYEPIQPEPAPRQSTRNRRQPVQEYDEDLYEDPYVLDEDEIVERPQRRSQRAPRKRTSATATAGGFAMPAFIAEAPVLKDRTSLIMLGTGLASVLLMIIIVAMKRSGLGDAIPTHINANGEAQVIETSGAIWQLPLIAAMVTLISSVVAWFLAKWGAFLPRFLLGGSLGVQFIVWVAVYAFLF